ncbi:hypothetical protein CKA34_01490 [Rhizobium sp. 11515TR]|uniref:RES family NAD+ phosphorylase n=1 Tax=Rhizobium sp. 11515TR TaxID=2028343 RepID=UPI000BA8BAA3|nr:RES family NAD+ phosphorylase [Rhizobium sp. 11515TR]ASW04712.1 hypothetical protein CKA34_01490 [Rhizobium sp. 11515TR]
MAPPARGPSGAAAPPPDWLKNANLPITTIPAGSVLHRIHRSSFDPVFFGPGAGHDPIYRFDSASGRFGVLYIGHAFAGAFAETILRNPQRLMVAEREIVTRSVTELTSRTALRMVTMHGAGLQILGTDNSISTGPYEPCGAWADALWDHPEEPDGIAYLSRHDPSEVCYAVFERKPIAFEAKATHPLSAMQSDVARLLHRYGKSLSADV